MRFLLPTSRIGAHLNHEKQKNRICFLLSGAAILALFVGSCTLFAATDSSRHWVGTWACAPYKATANTPPKELTGNTLRQIIRVSIGGDTVRVKFSNITFTKPVTIKSVNIAVSPDGTKSPVDASTIKELTFKGNAEVTINAKSEVYSDPVAFNLKPSMRLAITIYYGSCESSSDMTFHYGSRTNSYLLSGDKTKSADFSGATTVERWYTISTVDVLAPKSAHAVAVIGNSITDGASLSGGLQDRWTDRFSEALLANEATKEVGVLNLGIGATNILSPGNGADAGIVRFPHDILEQSGLHWVIIFYGVNDLAAGKSADEIYNGIKKMIGDTRAKDPGIKVYGGTITPFNGHSYYSTAHEAVRITINDMIRTSKDLDGFIDFAKALQDPNDPTKMKAAYNVGRWNDWLHPGPEGHKAMGNYIKLDMFTPPTVQTVTEKSTTGSYPATLASTVTSNGTAAITFNLRKAGYASVKVYSLSGKELVSITGKNFPAGKSTLPLSSRRLTRGTYLVTISTNEFSTSHQLLVPGCHL